MRKLPVLGLVLAFAVFLAFAQDQDFSKVQIKVTRVAGWRRTGSCGPGIWHLAPGI